MQFLITGQDWPGGLDRRLANREAHLENARAMYAEGTLLYAGAMLDEGRTMIGSTLIVEFESERAMRETWLAREPYVVGDVWETVRVQPFQSAGFLEG